MDYNKEYVMDFDKFLVFNEAKKTETEEGTEKGTEEGEGEEETDDEIMEAVDALTDAYEANVLEMTEAFLDDMEADFVTINESEASDIIGLMPVMETLLDNTTDGDVLESVIATLDSYEELYEAESPVDKAKKKDVLGKVKGFAKKLWNTFKEWFAAAKAKIGKMAKGAKKKFAEADLKNKAKAKKKLIGEKIKKSKNKVAGIVKNLFKKKKK